MSVRPNLWLFPFINIYAIAGVGHTNVKLPFNGIASQGVIPINKEIVIDQDGYMYGRDYHLWSFSDYFSMQI